MPALVQTGLQVLLLLLPGVGRQDRVGVPLPVRLRIQVDTPGVKDAVGASGPEVLDKEVPPFLSVRRYILV